MSALTFDAVVERLGKLSAAADELSRLPAMGPQILAQVGKAYTLLGAHDRAAGFLRAVADAAPFDASAQYNIGSALVFTGEFEEARRRLTEALRLEPRHYPAWYALVGLERQTVVSNHIPALLAQFSGPDPTGDRTLHIGHALAKTYEDLGDFETAFDWLVKAKAVRRSKADYSASREDALFAAAAQSHKAGKGAGRRTEAPIFISGLPRTGTTLIEAILSAHPQVTAGGEFGIFPSLVKHIGGGSDRHILDPENLRELAGVDPGRLGSGYIEATRPMAGDTPRFTDKTLINTVYAGAIHRALPDARIITLRRDPMDSIISFYRNLFFATPHVYPSVYDLENAAHHYVRFHRLADHWREVLPADRYLELSYEALVADQENETRRLLDFVGLPFDARSLEFHSQQGVVATASAVQVRKPLYDSSIGRWKRYGDKLRPAVAVLEQAGIAFS